MKRYFPLITAMLLSISLSAATYYASPTGTGDGSFDNPCSFKSVLEKAGVPVR